MAITQSGKQQAFIRLIKLILRLNKTKMYSMVKKKNLVLVCLSSFCETVFKNISVYREHLAI